MSFYHSIFFYFYNCYDCHNILKNNYFFLKYINQLYTYVYKYISLKTETREEQQFLKFY